MKNVETFSAAILSGSKWSSASSWAAHKNCWLRCSPRYHTHRQLYYIRTFAQWQGKNEKKNWICAVVCNCMYSLCVRCCLCICLLLSVSEYLVSLNHGVGGVMCQGRVFQISYLDGGACTQVQATVQTQNLTASCVLNGEISLINVKIGYRIHKDK